MGVKSGNFLVVGQEKAYSIVFDSTLVEQPVGEQLESFTVNWVSSGLVLDDKISWHVVPLTVFRKR